MDSLAPILKQLPIERCWYFHETPLIFSFGESFADLGDDWSDDFRNKHLAFGDREFDGGGSTRLCVRKSDGWVVGLDWESDSPEVSFNSSIAQFVKTFECLDPFLSRNATIPKDSHATLHMIDPEAYRSSDWKQLVDYLLPS